MQLNKSTDMGHITSSKQGVYDNGIQPTLPIVLPEATRERQAEIFGQALVCLARLNFCLFSYYRVANQFRLSFNDCGCVKPHDLTNRCIGEAMAFLAGTSRASTW